MSAGYFGCVWHVTLAHLQRNNRVSDSDRFWDRGRGGGGSGGYDQLLHIWDTSLKTSNCCCKLQFFFKELNFMIKGNSVNWNKVFQVYSLLKTFFMYMTKLCFHYGQRGGIFGCNARGLLLLFIAENFSGITRRAYECVCVIRVPEYCHTIAFLRNQSNDSITCLWLIMSFVLFCFVTWPTVKVWMVWVADRFVYMLWFCFFFSIYWDGGWTRKK